MIFFRKRQAFVCLFLFEIDRWNKRGISPAVQSPLAQNIPLFRLLGHCPLNSWWLRSSVSRICLCLRRSSAKSAHGHCPIFVRRTKSQTSRLKMCVRCSHAKNETILFRIVWSSIFWFCAPFLPFPTLSNCESRLKLQRKRCSTCFS